MELFIKFFQFAPELGLMCGFLVSSFLVIAPINHHLKAGVFAFLVPLVLGNFLVFSHRVYQFMTTVLKAYRWPGFDEDFLTYNEKFIAAVYGAIRTPEILSSLLATLGLCLGTYLFSSAVLTRFLRNSKVIAPSIAAAVALVCSYASYGILLPFLILSVIFLATGVDVQRRILAGREAIKDMHIGLFLAKMRIIFYLRNGILIHELLRIPRKFEDRGIIIFGAPGSGKSNLIKTFFLPQIRARGDMVILYDYKGEFTQYLGEDDDVLIISPLDARSAIWNVAADIDTEAKAAEFGRMVVQQGDSPNDAVFEDWARDILAAALVKLQTERSGNWTFRDLYALSHDLEGLIKAVDTYRAESKFAANFTGESRQFEAIKGTLRRAMVRLEPLARAWGDTGSGLRLFSISQWLRDHGGQKPILLIRDDPLYQETMGPFISNFINSVFAMVLSLPDAKGKYRGRRVWAVLDEFQVLPKIPKLFEAARAGRSKGLRMLLGTQDLGRISRMYRAEGSDDTLINLIGFKLIGHLGSKGMQDFAAGLLSTNQVEIMKKNVQINAGKKSVSYSVDVANEPGIASGEFGAIGLPTAHNGAVFWLVHQGWNPVKLRYITKLVVDKYEAKIDEAWLSDRDRAWKKERLMVTTSQEKHVDDSPSVSQPSMNEEVIPIKDPPMEEPATIKIGEKPTIGISQNYSLDDHPVRG